jgi:transcriptional regulator with XRE-family HTH domain
MDDETDSFASAVLTEIRAELAAKNLTVAEVAERIGVHYNTLGRYLKGERDMSFKDFLLLCRALGVSAEFIFSRAHERSGE